MKLKHFLSIAILLQLILISCENDNQITKENLMNVQYTNGNPYEYLGIEHNLLMEYAMNTIEFDGIAFSSIYNDRKHTIGELSTVALMAYYGTGINVNITPEEVFLQFDTLNARFDGQTQYDFFNTMFYDCSFPFKIDQFFPAKLTTR